MKDGNSPTKYSLRFGLQVDGVVEENDVVGAIFGQTEGLLGPLFDLREMQRTGKIGRIEVRSSKKNGNTRGHISITCGMDMASTTLLAALVESVDQIGPCDARIQLKDIKDYRKEKIEEIIERAKNILDEWRVEAIPEAEDLIGQLRKYVTPPHVTEVGKERIAAGPTVSSSDEVILVEGRADVNNLVKYGIENVLALGGANIADSIKRYAKGKTVTAFLDGDRGGDITLKKLLQLVDVDYVTRAPKGKEVEDLKPKEIFQALERKEALKEEAVEEKDELEDYRQYIDQVNGTLEAIFLNKKGNKVDKLPVSDVVKRLEKKRKNSVKKLVFDGVVTDRLVSLAQDKGIEVIVGNRKGDLKSVPSSLQVRTFGQ